MKASSIEPNQATTLYIKNMVCDRCILAVRQELDKLHLNYKNIQLGEVELAGEHSSVQITELKGRLNILGFELLDDKKAPL
jgi:AraC family transcriptional regulator